MKRLSNVLVATTMTIALGLSLVNTMGPSQAKKAKPSLPKKVTLKVSQTKTLKLKSVTKSKIKKTTWTVSNKKKVKLSQKAKNQVKIKGLKTGTVKVNASVKMGKKKYKLSTTVVVSKKTAKNTSAPVITPTNPPAASPAPTAGSPAKPTTVPTTAPTEKPYVPTASPIVTPVPTPDTSMEDMAKLPDSSTYEKTIVPPSLLTMLDGTTVTTKAQWAARRHEIRCILQRYMYGIWRNGTGEDISYTIKDNTITITIKKDGKESSFNATYTVPEGTAPESGWPVIVSVGGIKNSYISEKGYATISFNPNDIASDNTARTGAFYTLYPYDTSDWKTQTGAVLAWAWGAGKVIDALEKGAFAELNISPVNTIVTGVSRYGKAAAAAGAFEERFKVSMPVCSGYGGMTMSRYNSNGLTYNLLPDFENDPKKADAGDLSAWKSTGGNEPINSLSGSGWFNEAYKGFNSYQNLPFDSHFIASLSAADNHYLFIVTGINSDMWSSPPGFWWTYQEAKPAFDIAGVPDNMAIQMHLNLHGIETVDLCKLFTFTDYHFYDKTTNTADYPAPWNTLLADFTLNDLKTCVFASEANQAAYEAGKPQDPSLIEPNPDNTVPIKITVGKQEVDAVVSRSIASDALVSPLTGSQAGTGYNFRYGPEKQYGFSYARFTLTLPEGTKLSDFNEVTFNCVTDSNYYGKRMSLVANPLDTGLPEEIDFNYNSGAISTAYNLSGGMDFPNNTSTERVLTLPIKNAVATELDGQQIEFTIYIHMECAEGQAQYTLSNITFNKTTEE